MIGPEIAAGAAMLKTFQWVWDNFGKEISQSASGAIQKKWKSFQYKSAATAYAQQMKKRYGQMQLWKMSAPTSVDQIFTQVNILEKQSAFRHLPKAQIEKMILNEASFGETVEKRKDGMAVVRENNRLFILGKPGAGKTTFLKHITLQAIKGKIDAIPIFVTLQELSESQLTLMDFITQQFDICGFPEALPFIETLLKEGKAIVLFDGLDEVNTAQGLRDKQIQAMKDFSHKYDRSKVVITCRVAATEYNFEGFTYVEMADFDDEQIKTFVRLWFAKNKKTSELFFEAFKKQEGNRLRDLAKNPFLLTLLCIGFEETLRFPNRRSEIYGEALNALLQKRDSSRGIKRDEIYHKLSLGRKNQMFARIAAETFEKGKYLIEKKPLEKKIVAYLKNLPPGDPGEEIDGEAVLKAIEAQHGIFVERAKGIYSFAHLSFQEYYAAQYTVSHPKQIQKLIAYCGDPRWREVFLLTAELLDDADSFFDHFIRQLNEHASKEERLNALLVKGRGRTFELRILALWNNIISTRALDSSLTTISNDAIVLIAKVLPYDLSKSASSRNLDKALARTRADVLDRELTRGRDWFKEALSFSQKEDKACHCLLAKLSFPRKNATKKTRQDFADAVYKIFKARCRIEDYEFTTEEFQHVNKYLEATILLHDCLKVAYVSDRAGIEDQLLQPAR